MTNFDRLVREFGEDEAVRIFKALDSLDEINGITDDDEESWYQWIAKESSPPENEERRYHV